MSFKVRAIAALALVTFAAACAPKAEEPVYVAEQPAVSTAPTYTGKYK